MHSGQSWKNLNFGEKKGVAIVCHVVLDGGFLSSVQKET